MNIIPFPSGMEPGHVSAAKDIVFNTLDTAYYDDETFFQDTEDGQMPDFIGLADKIIEDLTAAGISIPKELSKEPR